MQALDMYLAERRAAVAGILQQLVRRSNTSMADVMHTLCVCVALLQVDFCKHNCCVGLDAAWSNLADISQATSNLQIPPSSGKQLGGMRGSFPGCHINTTCAATQTGH